MEEVEQSKISYYETRTINIGDYESVQSGLTISSTVIRPAGGYGDNKLKISESASTEMVGVNDLNAATNQIIKFVKKKLDAVEKEIRTQISGWEGISYDAEKKMVARKILKETDYSGKHKERFELTDEDLK